MAPCRMPIAHSQLPTVAEPEPDTPGLELKICTADPKAQTLSAGNPPASVSRAQLPTAVHYPLRTAPQSYEVLTRRL